MVNWTIFVNIEINFDCIVINLKLILLETLSIFKISPIIYPSVHKQFTITYIIYVNM